MKKWIPFLIVILSLAMGKLILQGEFTAAALAALFIVALYFWGSRLPDKQNQDDPVNEKEDIQEQPVIEEEKYQEPLPALPIEADQEEIETDLEEAEEEIKEDIKEDLPENKQEYVQEEPKTLVTMVTPLEGFEKYVRKDDDPEYIFNIDEIPLHEIQFSDKKLDRRKDTFFTGETSKGDTADIPLDFVAIDVYTRHRTYNRERIIELCAVKFIDGKPIERFYSLINPEAPFPKKYSVGRYDIQEEHLINAPTIDQVLPDFDAFVGGFNVVLEWTIRTVNYLYESGSNITLTPRKYFDTHDEAKKFLKARKKYFDGTNWSLDKGGDYDVEYFGRSGLLKAYKIPEQLNRYDADRALETGELLIALVQDAKRRKQQ